jgi:hypothetical protein
MLSVFFDKRMDVICGYASELKNKVTVQQQGRAAI